MKVVRNVSNHLPSDEGFSLGVLSYIPMSSEYTVTFNKGTNVVQHVYHSTLDEYEFTKLMIQEWMIDSDNEDLITVESLDPVA